MESHEAAGRAVLHLQTTRQREFRAKDALPPTNSRTAHPAQVSRSHIDSAPGGLQHPSRDPGRPFPTNSQLGNQPSRQIGMVTGGAPSDRTRNRPGSRKAGADGRHHYAPPSRGSLSQLRDEALIRAMAGRIDVPLSPPRAGVAASRPIGSSTSCQHAAVSIPPPLNSSPRTMGHCLETHRGPFLVAAKQSPSAASHGRMFNIGSLGDPRLGRTCHYCGLKAALHMLHPAWPRHSLTAVQASTAERPDGLNLNRLM